MDNRYPITGVVVDIGPKKNHSQYFSKQMFKIRISDTDFANKITQRIIRFDTVNENMKFLDSVRLNDLVKIDFYIDGRDYDKDGSILNFTSLICYNLEILSSESRDTKEDKEAVITGDGKDYTTVYKPATDEDLSKYMVGADTFVEIPKGNNTESFQKTDEFPINDVFDKLPF